MSAPWRATLRVQLSSKLLGDKVILPPSCLEELETAIKGEHLSFELSNARRDRRVSGAVLEFSADDGVVILSPYTQRALGVSEGDHVHLSSVFLPKGHFARLRPIGQFLDTDLRALLEGHLRRHFATLTVGGVLSVPTPGDDPLDVLIVALEPENSVSIIDTELEVDLDIVSSVGPSTTDGPLSLTLGDPVGLVDTLSAGHVRQFTVTVHGDAPIRLDVDVTAGDLDLFASVRDPRPSHLDNDWASLDYGSRSVPLKRDPPEVDYRGGATVRVAVRACEAGVTYRIRASSDGEGDGNTISGGNIGNAEASSSNAGVNPSSEYEICSNCGQSVPIRSFPMHSAFCLRNNTRCVTCSLVLLTRDAASHWHCPTCLAAVPPASRPKHVTVSHAPVTCSCGSSLPIGAPMRRHRRLSCPDRMLVCRFCGDLQKAGHVVNGIDQLGEHESYCGARTADCAECGRPVKLTLMAAHSRLHDLERRSRPPPPPPCANQNCGNAQPTNGNALLLCRDCFAPLYSPERDDDGKRLLKTLLAAYHNQIMHGCGRSDCGNINFCATAAEKKREKGAYEKPTANQAAVKALEMLKKSKLMNSKGVEYALCVSRWSQGRREAAERLVREGYDIRWCIEALDKCGGDEVGAKEWLKRCAPTL